LLKQLVLAEGRVVYDPKVEPHHHFVDDESGAIEDIPWGALRVGKVDELEGVDVRDYMVVVRGRKKRTRAR
jgi:Fur family iron response transcriptional regulator